jgi:hypothetical protein
MLIGALPSNGYHSVVESVISGMFLQNRCLTIVMCVTQCSKVSGSEFSLALDESGSQSQNKLHRVRALLGEEILLALKTKLFNPASG